MAQYSFKKKCKLIVLNLMVLVFRGEFLAWLPHAHLGMSKSESQTHMCDSRSKFGIFPAALPRGSGFV